MEFRGLAHYGVERHFELEDGTHLFTHAIGDNVECGRRVVSVDENHEPEEIELLLGLDGNLKRNIWTFKDVDGMEHRVVAEYSYYDAEVEVTDHHQEITRAVVRDYITFDVQNAVKFMYDPKSEAYHVFDHMDTARRVHGDPVPTFVVLEEGITVHPLVEEVPPCICECPACPSCELPIEPPVIIEEPIETPPCCEDIA